LGARSSLSDLGRTKDQDVGDSEEDTGKHCGLVVQMRVFFEDGNWFVPSLSLKRVTLYTVRAWSVLSPVFTKCATIEEVWLIPIHVKHRWAKHDDRFRIQYFNITY
jgi:hypothetical protein